MKVDEFKKCMDLLSFCYFDKFCFFPRGMELETDDKSFHKEFKTYDDLFEFPVNGKTIREIIEDENYDPVEYIE